VSVSLAEGGTVELDSGLQEALSQPVSIP